MKYKVVGLANADDMDKISRGYPFYTGQEFDMPIVVIKNNDEKRIVLMPYILEAVEKKSGAPF